MSDPERDRVPERVLVTGGAGFIGSHLVERLLEDGDEVIVVDDLSTGSLDNLARVRHHERLHLVVDTIMNYPMMNENMSRADRVYHLAAAVGVKKIMDEPVETITTNVRGSEIVLSCCHDHGVPLLIASTSEIYGKAGDRLHEGHDRVLGPTSKRRWAYACTKTLDEFLALAYHGQKDLPVIVCRFFNTVGPRQTGAWGMVVPTFVGQALAGEAITVYGDGSQRRSFCHVDDTIRAVTGLMDEPRAYGQVFNVGREEEVTILELAELVRERTGSDSEIRLVPYDDVYDEGYEDMERRQPDVEKLRELLGWSTTKDLETIVDEVVAHMRESGADAAA